MSKDLKTASPREVRALIRAGEITLSLIHI